MADELRERARKFLNDTERIVGNATVSALVEFSAAERALAIEECAKIAEARFTDSFLGADYRTAGNEIAYSIRDLIPTPLPTDGDQGDETK